MKWKEKPQFQSVIPEPLLTLTLTGRPLTVNHAYMTRKGSYQRIMKKESKEIISLWEAECFSVKEQFDTLVKPCDLLGVSFTLYFETWASDIDNALKIPSDCVARILGFNDNRIVERIERKYKDAASPRIDIGLWIIPWAL